MDSDELRSTVSARSFTGFLACSILNSVQSRVLERPSRLRSRTRLLRGSEAAMEALLPAGLGASGLGLGSWVVCRHGSSVTGLFTFSSGRDLNGQNTPCNQKDGFNRVKLFTLIHDCSIKLCWTDEAELCTRSSTQKVEKHRHQTYTRCTRLG